MRKLNYLLTLPILLFSQHLFAHGISESHKSLAETGGFFDFIWLGAVHMVTGYDHLLFIFGVIFFLTQFKDIVKFITAFTIGHSITLIAATFMGITANEFLVDAVIALTVVYKGFDNLDGFQKYLKMKAPNMLALVFSFGLIHGFGLSTRLQHLHLPESTGELLGKITAFNIGVELGQIIALTLMLIALASWRKTSVFAKFTTLSNWGLILAGFGLFVFQLIEYNHHSGKDGTVLHERQIEANPNHHDHDFEHGHSHGHDHHHGHDHNEHGHSHGSGHSHGTYQPYHGQNPDKKGHGHSHGEHEHQ